MVRIVLHNDTYVEAQGTVQEWCELAAKGGWVFNGTVGLPATSIKYIEAVR